MYLLSLVKIESIDPSESSKTRLTSKSVKALLPITSIVDMAVEVPSSTSISTSTLFLGRSFCVTTTVAPYLPCCEYCACSPLVIKSKVALLRTEPSLMPSPFNAASRSSVLIAELPSIYIFEIVGLS